MKKALSVLLAMAMLLAMIPVGVLSASAVDVNENTFDTVVGTNDYAWTEDDSEKLIYPNMTEEGSVIASPESSVPGITPLEDTTSFAEADEDTFNAYFWVEGEIYAAIPITVGDYISYPSDPYKDGNTFIGWDNYFETMPAEDIYFNAMFDVNTYYAYFMVDGMEYTVIPITYGEYVSYPDDPSKEGNTFIGWDNYFETMPAEDIYFNAMFDVNTYYAYFIVDGMEYTVIPITYGEYVSYPDDPSKEGNTFIGWDNYYETMPAEDIYVNAMFDVNTYYAYFIVDGMEYTVIPITYGEYISYPDDPSKEGNTFIGWDNYYETMPAEDIYINAMFDVNTYYAYFIVDGMEYTVIPITYGEYISYPDDPYKEGYTFLGWQAYHETMPAEDSYFNAVFEINIYYAHYFIDGIEYTAIPITYGEYVNYPADPNKDGYIFIGWDTHYETMPAEDIYINAMFDQTGDYVYRVADSQATITGYTGAGGDITIPSTLGGCPVTTIGNMAFLNSSRIINVNINSGLVTIGDFAFGWCSNLKSVQLPSTLEVIGDSAFSTTDIVSLILPKSVREIGDNLFFQCDKLEEIYVEAGSTSFCIFDGALFDFNKTRLIKYPPLRNATSYIIPNTVQTIDGAAFQYSKLINVLLSDKVETIGEKAFAGCTLLNSITIPDSTRSIGFAAFENCLRFVNISLPNNLTSIAGALLAGCYSLESIVIPKGVSSISSGAFIGCDSLTSINVDSENEYFVSQNGVLFNKTLSTLVQCPGGKAGSYFIPNTVTDIFTNAFYGCSKLTDINIPNSVLNMGWAVFNECDKLTSFSVSYDNPNYLSENGVLFNKLKTSIIRFPCGKSGTYDIPNSVVSIEDCSFQNCISLTKITIPDSVETIGTQAFFECKSITSIIIPNSVTSIGDGSFSRCDTLKIYCNENSYTQTYALNNNVPCVALKQGLSIIKVPNKLQYSSGEVLDLSGLEVVFVDNNLSIDQITTYEVSGYDANISGNQIITITHNSNTATFNVFVASTEEKDYTYSIADSQATITRYTGAGGDITIPSTLGGYPVTVIGNSSFYNCDNLISTTIPYGVIEIGYNAFYDCSSLISVIIPDSVVTIRSSAFYACVVLDSVFLPDSVDTLGENAFGRCIDLNQFAVDADNSKYTQLDGVLFDKSKTNLIQYPGGKSGVYNIPNSVTKIGNYAFGWCYDMALGTIPDSVTVIGESAFYACYGIHSVNIPASVVTIGNGAFSNCINLSQIGLDPTNENFSIVDGVLFNKTRTTLVQFPAGKSGCYYIPVGVVTIRNSAFNGCIDLTSVTIPDSVKAIGSNAFNYCYNLTLLSMGSGVETIGDFAFYYCNKLKSIVIYNSSTTIGNGVFLGCSSLTIYGVSGSTAEVYANGNSIPFIDEGLIIFNLPDKTAYYLGEPLNLTGLQVILIDNSIIEKITDYEVGGYDAKAQGTQEITISYDNKFAVFNIIVKIFEDDYTYTVTDSKATITGYTGAGGDIIIPSILGGYPVTSIGDCSFITQASITAVTIPNSVLTIGNQAFEYCHKLITINIPNSVTGLGWRAFYGCNNLTQINVDTGNTELSSLDGVLFNNTKTGLIQYPGDKTGAYTIPNSVTTIYYEAFNGCAGLTAVMIPDSVISIGEGEFEGCHKLTEINVSSENTVYSSLDGVLFNKTKTELSRYPNGKTGAYTVPNGVTSIGYSAFFSCGGMTAVTIPVSVININGSAFYGCDGLTTITLPNSVISVGDLVFAYCMHLTTVNISSSVISIGNGVFFLCNDLTQINVDTENTEYSSIDGVMFNKTKTNIIQYPYLKIGAFTIPNSVICIDSYAFSQCTGLTTIVIPESVINIGSYAFPSRPNMKIRCFKNSTAHTYAVNNSINYELINISPSLEGPGCSIDYANNIITGLSGGITSLEDYFKVEAGYELSYTPTPNGFGTGTIVNVVSTTKNAMTNSVVASYTVIIYGDVNGDASIDSIDAGLVVDYENYVINWDSIADAAKLKAADLNGDGSIDSLDAGITVDAENYVITIDQTTGLVA